ncbi:MAG TPA: biotin--[acetyl-CoA-carboxylase] ligase [Clostridiales bacterium]|nr:biotin--[acetyl-CoA-carboxylase] ligase [Clostridiales bacterium]
MSNYQANEKINLQLIQNSLSTRYIGQTIYYREQLESTNTFAKQEANNLTDGCVVLCDIQSAGHGRMNRYWYSAPYKNINMSVIIKPNIQPQLAPRFTILSAVSLCEMLKDLGFDAQIKWPNDIIVNKRKVAGILLDCTIEGNIVKYVVAGIGINVNTAIFEGELSSKATSLYIECGVEHSREQLIAAILNTLERNIGSVYSSAGYESLMQRYKDMSYVLGKTVTVLGISSQTEGEVIGFDEMGQIIIITKLGNIVTFNSGEISIKY